MKRLIVLSLSLLLLAATADAQNRGSRGRKSETCPKLYIGISTGIENPSGLMGFNMDVPVKNLSLGAGTGFSSWGYKSYFEARYYFKPCNRGWAVGTGVTYNTRSQNYTINLPTTLGDQDVSMILNHKTNVYIAGYRFWNLGKGGGRFYLGLGYSFRLDENNYSITSGHVLTNDGKTVMRILAPGGLMIAAGLSFGILK